MAKKGLVQGAIILTVAGVICRLVGLLFRIPFANIVGNYGIGLYQLVFPLYSLLLIVSSAGVPVALSKMIARVREDKPQCRRILFNAVVALAVIGAVLSGLFAGLCVPLSIWQGKPEIWPLYLAIAPAVLFVALISALRGYFQGRANMIPTAVTQVSEQVIKVGIALPLALWWQSWGTLWAVFGAIIAVSVAELLSLLGLVVFFLIKERPPATERPLAQTDQDPVRIPLFSWTVQKQIFQMSAPIMAQTLVFPVVLLFDSFFIVNSLQSAGVANATELYGISSGAVHTLINVPSVVGIAIATVLLPLVSRAFHQKKFAELKKKAFWAIVIALIGGVIISVGLAIVPEWLLNLLYHRTFAGKPDELATAVLLLRVESAVVTLMLCTQVVGSVLQAVDRAQWPLWALLIGGVAKVGLEIFGVPTWGIVTVSIANVVCFAVALLIDFIGLIKFWRCRE